VIYLGVKVGQLLLEVHLLLFQQLVLPRPEGLQSQSLSFPHFLVFLKNVDGVAHQLDVADLSLVVVSLTQVLDPREARCLVAKIPSMRSGGMSAYKYLGTTSLRSLTMAALVKRVLMMCWFPL
jgi:hypothetical protein